MIMTGTAQILCHRGNSSRTTEILPQPGPPVRSRWCPLEAADLDGAAEAAELVLQSVEADEDITANKVALDGVIEGDKGFLNLLDFCSSLLAMQTCETTRGQWV